MTAVFISYSRHDQDFVRRLHDALAQREYDVWVDWEDIPPSAEWFGEIKAGVTGADGFIYVISPESASSEICRRELAEAIGQGKRVVPVLHREPDGNAVPEAAASLNWVFLRESDDFAAGVQQLIAALETDLDHVRAHTRLGVQAAGWEASGRDKSRLLRGAELAAAEAWLVSGAGKEPQATTLQREYVLASRQAATRRQRGVIGAVTVALAVAIALAVVALIQKATADHERDVALARQYDVEAQGLYNSRPVVGLLLARRAAQLAPSAETETALRDALAQSHERIRYELNDPSLAAGDAIWSPDGTRLLVTSPDTWARIYTPGSNAAPVTLGTAADPGAPSDGGESAWDARGDRVVFGGGRPAVYDARTGHLVARLAGTALFTALSADGSIAVTVDVKGVGHAFDLASGRELARFTPALHGIPTCFALAPDDRTVAQCDTSSQPGGSNNSDLDTWDLHTGRLRHSVPFPGLMHSVSFSPDGRRYIFAGLRPGSGTTQAQQAADLGRPGTFVYGTYSGRQVIAFAGSASAAAFSQATGPGAHPQVAWATLSDDDAHVYDFASGLTRTLSGASDSIDTLSFDAGGASVIAAGNDGAARVYQTITGGGAIETLHGPVNRIVQASFGRGDRLIATASDDGTTRVWQGPAPSPTQQLSPPDPHTPDYLDGFAQSLGFTPDGRTLLEASLTGQGRLLDAHSLKVRSTFSAPPGQGFAGAAMTRDGGALFAVSGPLKRTANGLQLLALTAAEAYDPRTGDLRATMTPRTPGPLSNAATSYDGTRLVTLGASGDSDLWDSRTGRLLHHLPGEHVAGAAAFSQDASQLAIAHYPQVPPTITFQNQSSLGRVTVDLFNALTGVKERTITGDQLTTQVDGEARFAPLSLAFSPNGRMLAVGGAGPDVEVYDPHTGATIRTLGLAGATGGSYANSLAFSPDGSLLAIGASADAYLWRVPTHGSQFEPLPAIEHVAALQSAVGVGGGLGVFVGFSPDSKFLITTGQVAARVWDPNTAIPTQLLRIDVVRRAALSPDGSTLAVTNGGGVSLFHCELCAGLDGLLKLADAHATQSLTPAERRTYNVQG